MDGAARARVAVVIKCSGFFSYRTRVAAWRPVPVRPVLNFFVVMSCPTPFQVWFACALATVGVALVSLGGILPPGINAADYIVGKGAEYDPTQRLQISSFYLTEVLLLILI